MTGAERAGRSLVLAVSGTSGAGKTTVIEGVEARLGSATRLHFDDYLVLGTDVGEIGAWLAAGADPDAVSTPDLAADLAALAVGREVEAKNGPGRISPQRLIILEEPFGRARREIAPLVDLAVHLQVPADVALGRRLLRAIGALSDDDGHAGLVADIEGQLRAFLAAGRDAYLAADRAAGAAADLVLDGMRPSEELVDRIVGELLSRGIGA